MHSCCSLLVGQHFDRTLNLPMYHKENNPDSWISRIFGSWKRSVRSILNHIVERREIFIYYRLPSETLLSFPFLAVMKLQNSQLRDHIQLTHGLELLAY